MREYGIKNTSRKIYVGKSLTSDRYYIKIRRKYKGKEIKVELSLTEKSLELLMYALKDYTTRIEEITIWTHKKKKDCKLPKGVKVEFRTFNLEVTKVGALKKIKKTTKKK